MANHPPSAAALASTFDAAPAYTVGIEEEVMLLDPASLTPSSRALEVLAWLDGDPRFKPEMPASQIEILTGVHASVLDAAAELEAGRRELAQRTRGEVAPAAAGVSPLGSGVGELNALPRYEPIQREYGPIARRQLVCALQVHVAVGEANRALAVYNAVRSYLPWVAALAANAAYYEGRDSGLASVRPKLAELLPRQGVPPALRSWEEYAAALRRESEDAAFRWWWELRLHPRFGTLEFRVPDSQSTIADAAAIAAVIQALVAWLGERHDAGEELPVADTWRIAENRWSACRYGVEGWMAESETGARRETRGCLTELLESLGPSAQRHGAGAALEHAAELIETNGAISQRRIGQAGGPDAVARWLVERFQEPWAR